MEASAVPVPARFDPPSPSNGNALVPSDGAAELTEEQAFDAIELPAEPRLSGMTLAALAAVTGVVAIALGTSAFVSSVREPDTVEVVQTAPIHRAAQAISLLSKPSTERIPLAGSRGSAILAVGESGRGVLVLDGLGLAPIGRSYQAWVVDPRKRPREYVSAGTFTGVETIVPLSARVPRGWVLGVTIEKSGGASAPTQAFRIGAQRPAAERAGRRRE